MRKFDADQKAEEGGLEVIIGGQTFIAREPTLAVMKQLAEAAPKSSPEEDKDKSESERMQEGIDSIFPQLEILLQAHEEFTYDERVEAGKGTKGPDKALKPTKVKQGDPPPRGFVEDHLSMRRAGEMIQTLMGEDEAANPQ